MRTHPLRRRTPHAVLSALLVVAILSLVACSGDGASSEAAAGGDGGGGAITLRLGFFPNITHAPAIAGVERGIFERRLGERATLKTATFNAGPAAVEALFAGAIDATYIGPNPAINAYAKSGGEAIRIIAGTTSGGAFLVVRDGIDEPADLAGATIGTPQLGNTQDVAVRSWLASQGYETTPEGGGDVKVLPQENAQTLDAFKAGDIDGAWVPEPWATRLVQEGGGHVLVDERDLWPGGRYVTTHLIVRTEFLDEHPDVVKRLLEGHVEATAWVNEHPEEAKSVVNAAIDRISGKALAPEIIDAAWPNLTFTHDPIAASLRKSAKDAEAVGLLEPVDLKGIYDLSLLNEVLRAAGEEEVQAA